VSALVDAILRDIAARAQGRTRWEGSPPREDEVLAREIHTLRAENARLRDAALDALYGWRYIRQNHGDLYGVGWDRVENALTAALAPQEPGHE
jgi:hypothetical protein